MCKRTITLILVAAASTLASPAGAVAATAVPISSIAGKSLRGSVSGAETGAAQVAVLNTGIAQRISQVRREALLGMARLDSMARSGASDSSIMSAANAARSAINSRSDQGVSWVGSNSTSMIKALAKKAGTGRAIAAVQAAAVDGVARIEDVRSQSLAEIEEAMHRAMQ